MKLSGAIHIHAATAELRRPLSNDNEKWKTVLVDFDGVLSESSGPYARDHFGPPMKEGFKLVQALLDRGFQVIVFTARKETDSVAVWLKDHGFPHMLVTNHKVAAIAYVDDRALPWGDDSKAEDLLPYIEDPKKTLDLTVKR